MTKEVVDALWPSEAATILGVDRRTVYRWAEAGLIRAIRYPSGRRRYLREDIESIAATVRSAA